MTPSTKASIKLTLTMALVALVITSAKIALQTVPFYTFTWLQMVFAIGFLLIYQFAVDRHSMFRNVSRNDWFYLVTIGLLNYFLVRLLFVLALTELPVTTHAYLMNFVGIVTMLIGIMLLKELPSRGQIVGAGIAISGLSVFFSNSDIEGSSIGFIAVSFAVLCLALTNIAIRKFHQYSTSAISHQQVAMLTVMIGGGPIIIWGFLFDLPEFSISLANWFIIASNGIVANALVMLIFSQAMVVLKAFEASILAMSGLIFTAIFAVPMLAEVLTIEKLMGIAILLFGILLVNWSQSRN
jgi:drug/metabolite transporter (DMT)-like permease